MRCPICGEQFDPAAARMDSEWRDIIELLPSFGGHGNLVFEYVEKFGVNPLRIKSKKILRLLMEIARLLRTGNFTHQRREYSASSAVVIEALKVVNNKHFSAPLENHNYLKKVMISLAEEVKKEESKKAERELRRREDRLREGGDEHRTSNVQHRTSNGKGEMEEMTGPEYLASVGKESLRGGR